MSLPTAVIRPSAMITVPPSIWSPAAVRTVAPTMAVGTDGAGR